MERVSRRILIEFLATERVKEMELTASWLRSLILRPSSSCFQIQENLEIYFLCSIEDRTNSTLSAGRGRFTAHWEAEGLNSNAWRCFVAFVKMTGWEDVWRIMFVEIETAFLPLSPRAPLPTIYIFVEKTTMLTNCYLDNPFWIFSNVRGRNESLWSV